MSRVLSQNIQEKSSHFLKKERNVGGKGQNDEEKKWNKKQVELLKCDKLECFEERGEILKLRCNMLSQNCINISVEIQSIIKVRI